MFRERHSFRCDRRKYLSSRAKVRKCRDPGESRCVRMSAQLVGSLDRDAPSIPSDFTGKHLVNQIGRQTDPAEQLWRCWL